MLKIKTLLSVAVAVSGATLAASCFGQAACTSCAQGQAPFAAAAAQFAPAHAQFAPAHAQFAAAPAHFAPAQVGFSPSPQLGAPCDSCGPAAAPVQQVVYVPQQAPSGGCGVGGCGGGCAGGGCLKGAGGAGLLDELKAKCAHQKAINARTTARNDAWPKPFTCASRQLYFSFFESMVDQGWEEQCVLTSAHFDAETNQLNKFGQQAVAGIMQNNPSTRRVVFINRDVDEQINNIRRSTVQDTLNTFYGQTANASVAFSNKRPVTTSGARGAQIQEQWLDAQAVPTIKVGSGGSVASEVAN